MQKIHNREPCSCVLFAEKHLAVISWSRNVAIWWCSCECRVLCTSYALALHIVTAMALCTGLSSAALFLLVCLIVSYLCWVAVVQLCISHSYLTIEYGISFLVGIWSRKTCWWTKRPVASRLRTLVLAEPSQCHSRVIPMRYCPSIITAPDWRKKLSEWVKCSYCCYLTQQSLNVDCDSVVQSTWSAARGYPLLHSCWHLVCRVHHWWVYLSFNQMASRAPLQSLFCSWDPWSQNP